MFGLKDRGLPCRGGPRRSYIHVLLLHVYMYIYIIGYVLFCVCMYAPAAAAGVEATTVCSVFRKRPPVSRWAEA